VVQILVVDIDWGDKIRKSRDRKIDDRKMGLALFVRIRAIRGSSIVMTAELQDG
jgi:hypothetical protein